MLAPEFTLASIVQVNKDFLENFHLEFVCRVAFAIFFFYIFLVHLHLEILYGLSWASDLADSHPIRHKNKIENNVEAQWNAQLLGLDPRLIFCGLWIFPSSPFFCGFSCPNTLSSWLRKTFAVKLFKYKLFSEGPGGPFPNPPFTPCVCLTEENVRGGGVVCS